jgi:hypothetical protein
VVADWRIPRNRGRRWSSRIRRANLFPLSKTRRRSVPWHGVRTANTWQPEMPGAASFFSAIEERHHWLGIAFALSGARRKQLIDLREFVGGKGDV